MRREEDYSHLECKQLQNLIPVVPQSPAQDGRLQHQQKKSRLKAPSVLLTLKYPAAHSACTTAHPTDPLTLLGNHSADTGHLLSIPQQLSSAVLFLYPSVLLKPCWASLRLSLLLGEKCLAPAVLTW